MFGQGAIKIGDDIQSTGINRASQKVQLVCCFLESIELDAPKHLFVLILPPFLFSDMKQVASSLKD